MKKHKGWKYYLPMAFLLVYVLTAITNKWLAQSHPILYQKDGQWSSSFFQKSAYTFDEVDKFLLPLVPFGPQQTHIKEAFRPPLTLSLTLPQHKHILGTDKLGRDVLAGIIHGAGISLWIGFLSVFCAMFLGVPMGILASYYGDNGIRFTIFQWLFLIFGGFLFIFYLVFQWQEFSFMQILMYFILGIPTTYLVIQLLSKIKSRYKIPLPLDTIVIKISELRKSFPGLFLLLALTTLFGSSSIYNIVIIIVLLSWMEYARFARSESLSIIHSPFIESSRLMGFKDIFIIYKHILPHILPILMVLGSYGVSQAILLESSLSFLGIGLPTEVVTWGKMLADGRSIQHPWLVIFPGLAIFVLIFVLNIWADSKEGN